MVYAGHYICWVIIESSLYPKLYVYDLRTPHKNPQEVDLPTNLEREKSEHLSIEPCCPWALIRQGRYSKINRENFIKLASHVQISVGSHCFMIDLNNGVPRVVYEIDETD